MTSQAPASEQLAFKDSLAPDAIEGLKAHWRKESLFADLSDVQLGIVPFQIIHTVIKLRKFVTELLDEIDRPGFEATADDIGLRLGDDLHGSIVNNFPAIKDLKREVQKRHELTLQAWQMLRRETNLNNSRVPAGVDNEKLNIIIEAYRNYIRDLLESIEAKLGITELVPRLGELIK